VSPPPNWSPQGRASKDLLIRQARAPQSAFEVHRYNTWQPFAGIGHPLSLRLMPRRDPSKDPENVKRTALPLTRARRITGRGLRTSEPAFVKGPI
jgi:hypothetical protein